MSEVKEFTIDRKVWLRANEEDRRGYGSYLLREIDQKRCCLGIYLSACGVPDKFLEGVGSPGLLHRQVPEVRDLIPRWLICDDPALSEGGNSMSCSSMMEANDDDTTGDIEKESFLTERFAEQGVRVVFV